MSFLKIPNARERDIHRQARTLLTEIGRWESSLKDPHHLQHWEKSSWSQNGEDGILEEALKRLEITNPVFVEFGASDGSENCTRGLLERGGSGLWMEGDPELVEKAQSDCGHLPIDVVSAFLTKENIVELIQNSSRVCNGFDVLVVDIDGNDWWLAREILQYFSPALIVTEYNPFYGPTNEWVMPYNAAHSWQQDNYYGASLNSYAQMLRQFGYVLVACDSRAVNAFWVKATQRDLFTSEKSLRNLFVPALPGGRHRHRTDLLSNEELSEADMDQIEIEFIDIFQNKKSKRKIVCAQIINGSSQPISPFGKHPSRIGVSIEENLAATGSRLFFDSSVLPGTVGCAWGVFESDFEWAYSAVVQEGVRWGSPIRR
jgi:hypothetical protein